MPRKKGSRERLDPLSEARTPVLEVSFERRVVPSLSRGAPNETRIVDRLERLLNWVRGYSQQQQFERFGKKLSGRSPLEQIHYCAQALLSGALPDAETLEFVAIALDKYVRSDGSLSVDEAFGLRSKPKAGNPVRQEARRNKVARFLLDMAMTRAHNPQKSLERAAEEALQGDESIKIETLVREYRRRAYRKRERRKSGK